MDDLMDKIEAIYGKLEKDRQEALTELESMRQDILGVDPRFRHTAREICGQLIKLAIDASVAQAKVLEPLTKNQVAGVAGASGGSETSRKELIEALEALEKRDVVVSPPIEEAKGPEELVAPAVLEAEAVAAAQLEEQAKSAGTIIDATLPE